LMNPLAVSSLAFVLWYPHPVQDLHVRLNCAYCFGEF
jgi:hypothetical protein